MISVFTVHLYSLFPKVHIFKWLRLAQRKTECFIYPLPQQSVCMHWYNLCSPTSFENQLRNLACEFKTVKVEAHVAGTHGTKEVEEGGISCFQLRI